MLRYNDEGEVHSLFPSHYFEPLKDANIYKFAVIRDPIERFLSAYRHRVLDAHELDAEALKGSDHYTAFRRRQLKPNPTVGELIENLERYRFDVYQIKHHTDPQVLFLGHDPRHFDRVFLFEELAILPAELERATGAKIELRHEMRSTPRQIGLTHRDRQLLMEFYRDDYKLLEQVRRAQA